MTGKGVGCCKKMAEFLMLSVDDLEMIILELFLSFFYLIFLVSLLFGESTRIVLVINLLE